MKGAGYGARTMIETTIQGLDLRFETAPGLFSPQAVDEGTLALLAGVSLVQDDKVLELGCGWDPDRALPVTQPFESWRELLQCLLRWQRAA